MCEKLLNFRDDRRQYVSAPAFKKRITCHGAIFNNAFKAFSWRQQFNWYISIVCHFSEATLNFLEQRLLISGQRPGYGLQIGVVGFSGTPNQFQQVFTITLYNAARNALHIIQGSERARAALGNGYQQAIIQHPVSGAIQPPALLFPPHHQGLQNRLLFPIQCPATAKFQVVLSGVLQAGRFIRKAL